MTVIGDQIPACETFTPSGSTSTWGASVANLTGTSLRQNDDPSYSSAFNVPAALGVKKMAPAPAQPAPQPNLTNEKKATFG